MDTLWHEGVDGETKVVALGLSLPQGLDMWPSNLVKPFGSLSDPLLVLVSYPTAHPTSTVHFEYGMTNDLSSSLMSRLYTKLGYHVADYRKTGMLHVDIFPRRLDRNVFQGDKDAILTLMLHPYYGRLLYDIRRRSKVKPADAVAYWRQPAVVAKGPAFIRKLALVECI